MFGFSVVIFPEAGSYSAWCPDLDVASQGDTLEEAMSEISYVASSLIELYKEEGLIVPLKLRSVREESKPLLKFNFPLIVSTA